MAERAKYGERKSLFAHIQSAHHREPARTMRFTALVRWHTEQHHKYHLDHTHAYPAAPQGTDKIDRGPDNRPPGWHTGADAIVRVR